MGRVFTKPFPHDVDGVHAVLSNTCGQTYTFERNGIGSRYIGAGDRHDTAKKDNGTSSYWPS